jgi:hypothetical protein
MARARYGANTRIWLIAAGCLFVAIGFVDPVAGVTKGDNSLWSHTTHLVTGDYHCSTSDIVIPIVFQAVLLSVPSVMIGWVIQAFIVMTWPQVQTGTSSRR